MFRRCCRSICIWVFSSAFHHLWIELYIVIRTCSEQDWKYLLCASVCFFRWFRNAPVSPIRFWTRSKYVRNSLNRYSTRTHSASHTINIESTEEFAHVNVDLGSVLIRSERVYNVFRTRFMLIPHYMAAGTLGQSSSKCTNSRRAI